MITLRAKRAMFLVYIFGHKLVKMPKFKWDILGDFQTLCKYIFFLHLGFLSTRRVSKHIGKHFYYVCKGSLDLIIASGVMNTFRMISLQALQATKVAHRPWANLCIIIWANVAFQQKLSRSTSLHTISPFPLSNFRQFFFCIQTCVCFLLLRETMESDFFSEPH